MRLITTMNFCRCGARGALRMAGLLGAVGAELLGLGDLDDR
jgi:hypothetical protein